MNKIVLIVIAVAIAIVLLGGVFYVGYFLGNKNGFNVGKEQGFKDGQKAAQDVIDAANPYADLENAANPFQGEYENPF
jgi:flagellar basal body-associated protein FliL